MIKFTNVIQLATQDFCERFVDYRMDPGRRLYDQMVMAARCGVANIAEVWAIGNPYRESIWQVQLDAPNYSNSYLHDAAIHIYTQKNLKLHQAEHHLVQNATGLCPSTRSIQFNRKIEANLSRIIKIKQDLSGILRINHE